MEQIPAQPLNTKPRRSKKALRIIIGVVAALAVGAGVYAWQQAERSSERDALNKTVSDNKTLIDTLQGKNRTLTTEKESLQRQLETAVAPMQKAKLVKSSAVKYKYDNELTFVVVDLEMTNDTDKVEYFSPTDFKLKDASGNDYPLVSQSALRAQPRFLGGVDRLPDNRVEINGQSIEKGETVKGSIVFHLTRSDVQQVNLLYSGTSTPLPL